MVAKRLDFLDEPFLQPFVQTDFDALTDGFARKIRRDHQRIVQWFGYDGIRLWRRGDFDGADDPFVLREVGPLQKFRGGNGLKPFDKFFSGQTLQFFAKLLVRFAAGKGVAAEQGVDVERRAAGDDGQAAARTDAVHGRQGEFQKTFEMEILLRFNDIQQMAWDAIRTVAIFGQVLSRADIHATIDLPRVRADDFAVELSGEMDGEFCLAGCGWSCDDKGGVMHGFCWFYEKKYCFVKKIGKKR